MSDALPVDDRAAQHAQQLGEQLTARGLRVEIGRDAGTPGGVMTVAVQRVGVRPYAGRQVFLLEAPGRGRDGLFWHWPRPLRGHAGACWFQPFSPAGAPAYTAEVIAAAIDADVRARARSVHIPQGEGDAEFEEQILVRTGRPLHLLVYRVLALLDSVEREVEATDLLHELFRIDHLTTRTLRGLERLAVLGGATARQVNAPLPLATVMRQAVAQIEHYRRVRVQVPPPQVEADLPGYAGPEIALLLAELAENATKFSAPTTRVRMTAVPGPSRVSIEIVDQGLPMPADTYAALNRLLADPGTVSLRDQIIAGPIGLLVAARLAHRHGIQVRLHPITPEGTRAVVDLPSELLLAPRLHAVQLASAAGPAPAPPSPPASADGAVARGAAAGTRPPRRTVPSSFPVPLSPPPAGAVASPVVSPVAGSAEPALGPGGEEERPALPRRRRTRSPQERDPVSAPRTEGGRQVTTGRAAEQGPASQAGPQQQRDHDHRRRSGLRRGPDAGLLADFADAIRPWTEDPPGQGSATSVPPDAPPTGPPAGRRAD